MATRVQLNAEKRDMLGKKVRRLRRSGLLPATVYGQQTTPQSIQVNSRELRDVLHRAGRTQLIDLVIESQAARPVLIRSTAIDPKRNEIIHVEFFQANLREKLRTHVPIHFVGAAPAVTDQGGIFLAVLDHLDVESLPQDVPAGGIEVDISGLAELNGVVHAGEIPLPPGLTLLTSPDEVVCKVDPPVSEQVVEEIIAGAEPLPAELGGNPPQPDAVPES